MISSASHASRSDEKHIARFVNVSKSYDGRSVVLKDFNLDIAEGEFLTLLGASGSGKTTCLMLLAGFETASSGQIYLDGKLANAVPPWRRNIGVVFQNYAIFPHMTVAQNIAYPLRVRKVPRAESDIKVRRALEMVRLAKFADRSPAQLSGGQQQRVALARALVFDPSLVLMDEPLGALDRQLREEMQYEIKRLHAEIRASIVYVTHDQTEALVLSDRTAVMSGGRIEQIGPPGELYDAPDNPFVAGFFGENNSLAANVLSTDGPRSTVRAASGDVFTGMTVEPLSAGAAVQVFVRPERIAVLADGETADNVTAITVQQTVYHGDCWRLRGKTSDGSTIIVRVPPQLGAQCSAIENAVIRIGWSVQDCRILTNGEGR